MSFTVPENFRLTEPASLKISSDDEVYLIKVPKGYDINRLDGKEFISNQMTEIEVKEDKNQLTSVYELSCFTLEQPLDISPIIKNKKNEVTLGPQITGVINVTKSYRLGLSSSSQQNLGQPQEKRVKMPEGLKPRYVPFGSGQPYIMKKSKKRKRKLSQSAS